MNIQQQKERAAKVLFDSACGYGMAERNGTQSKFNKNGNYMPNKTGGVAEGGMVALKKCIDAIPDEYFSDFMYTLYRVAEKTGKDGFGAY